MTTFIFHTFKKYLTQKEITQKKGFKVFGHRKEDFLFNNE